MPLLASLISYLSAAFYGLLTHLVGARIAVRLWGVTFLATIYLSCVVAFSTMIGPWLENLFSTAYGSLLGLLFPPIAGTVIFGLGAYWTCVIGVRYVSSLAKTAMG